MKKLVLKFNAHPEGTLAKVVGLANAAGVLIESIEDSPKTKKILHKVVTIKGDAKSLGDLREKLGLSGSPHSFLRPPRDGASILAHPLPA